MISGLGHAEVTRHLQPKEEDSSCRRNDRKNETLHLVLMLKKSNMYRSDFKKAHWINSTSVYEVNLRQYTPGGTFREFMQELPRLKDMGVETLWFMPLTPISQKNRKGTLGSYYACSDYTAINPEFGTLEEAKALFQQAHDMGFKILIDWVANHTGWDHRWTKEHPEYYQKDETTGDFKKASGMDDIIELDYDHPGLREAMISAMQFWIDELDIDGFRCDLAFWVRLDFWAAARTALEKRKILFWLGELDPLDHPQYFEVFDAAYTWQWMGDTFSYYHEHTPVHLLKQVLGKYAMVCGNEHIPLWFTSNHDENSWNGTEYEKYGDMARALAVFSFTWNGLGLIYSGQELPNTARLEFFERDPIPWSDYHALHDFYKQLIHLKKEHPALRAADAGVHTQWIETGEAPMLCYLRSKGERKVMVLLNLGTEPQQVVVPANTYTDLFTGESFTFTAGELLELVAWEYRVLVKS